jgi:LEA14-like dessication related protein
MRSPALLGFAAASALACSKPAPPTLVPVSATVIELTPQGLDLTLALNATNPNGVSLSSQGVTAHVVVDKSVDLGSVTSTQAVSLAAGQTTLIQVPISVPWTSVLTLVQLGASNRAVPYAVDGTVAMGGTLVNVEIPFHLEGSVTHQQIVSATTRSIQGMPALPGLPR